MSEPEFDVKQFVRECTRLGVDIRPTDTVKAMIEAIQLNICWLDGLAEEGMRTANLTTLEAP
ncbi:MAG: hypothetical protein ABI612_17980 [Betaproteobacteria bacterium]